MEVSRFDAIGAAWLLLWTGALAGCQVYDSELLASVAARSDDDDDTSVAVNLCDAAADGCEGDAPAPSPLGDACPEDPAKTLPGVCGCGVADVDRDQDGTADCRDACPRDAAKTAPGACGCGNLDTDTDSDDTADCLDGCVSDPDKTAPGVCGCGKPETDRGDGGALDCADHCPQDPLKREPGICGCGTGDPADATAGAIYCAKSELAHRYSFDANGSATASDSIGGADATIEGQSGAKQIASALALQGDGLLGHDAGYASLPETALHSLSDATFEVWILWLGSSTTGIEDRQRIFEFGSGAGLVDARYLYLSPKAYGGIRAAFTLGGSGEQEIAITTRAPSPRNKQQHLAVVIDQSRGMMRLYTDGELAGAAPLRGPLSELAPTRRFLGRSSGGLDPGFVGQIFEFRIYAVALSDEQLRASAKAGPDYAFAP